MQLAAIRGADKQAAENKASEEPKGVAAHPLPPFNSQRKWILKSEWLKM